MNRALLIILVPALLVAIGYVMVFRLLGESPQYWRLLVPIVALGGALLWFAFRSTRKQDSDARH